MMTPFQTLLAVATCPSPFPKVIATGLIALYWLPDFTAGFK